VLEVDRNRIFQYWPKLKLGPLMCTETKAETESECLDLAKTEDSCLRHLPR